ncbi:MAG: efflux RND transporter permease subunit [Candidatus Krumholzibacteriia bacterium]
MTALIRFCLDNKLVMGLLVLFAVGYGAMVAPFDWDLGGLPRDPVPVDAIPDLGENQQIVFTEWMGRSPQDVEDQITYPLTVSLLGLPDVRTVRSYSMFGFSSIYVIFEERADFYDSRSRILEKLASLPSGTLPEGVQPSLGPDATGLGQVFWYTLEGRTPDGEPAGGWDPQELRTIQDWYVRYALLGAEGVAEVASVGGFVREYQVDVDPDAMRAQGVTLGDVFQAVRGSNVDVGARTIEVNRVEYFIRGLGFLESVDDLRRTVVKVVDSVPVTIDDVAHVALGPALRRGALDKEGAEAVGGVVVVRYRENPLAAIRNVKQVIAEITPGLPVKTLPDGTTSKVTIVPFYDRSGLIDETLGTLDEALSLEVLVTVIVIIVMVANLRSSLLVSGLLPLAVLMTFIGMKLFRVDANIVALSGIAIAIGTMVDMGIVMVENILQQLRTLADRSRRAVILAAASEVGGAVLTAVLTTVVSFLPVFAMTDAEGKLFRPLAFTKTFALIAAVIVALTVIPPFAHMLLTRRAEGAGARRLGGGLLVAAAALAFWKLSVLVGAVLLLWGAYLLLQERMPAAVQLRGQALTVALPVLAVGILLTRAWLPLGPGRGFLINFVVVALLLAGFLLAFTIFMRGYIPILRWCLDHKTTFLAMPVLLVLVALMIWQGFAGVFGWLPGMADDEDGRWGVWEGAVAAFPGLGQEFMPSLDEGSFLFMPTTMPHASIGEAMDVLSKLDMAISSIPEVESAVGKIGRAESALDPAPISMIETVVNYHSEFRQDAAGRLLRFAWDQDRQDFVRDEEGEPVPDADGRPYRQWRPEIRTPGDIWEEIVRVTRLPGTTSAPRLQPIETRLVMLQSGMRAPMGMKIRGPDLETLERVALRMEEELKHVPGIRPETVVADRIVGKPYLEIDIDRDAIARHGLSVRQVQDVIEVALGGRMVTTTVEGRERYPVRVRYLRERRDTVEDIGRVLVPTPMGQQIPLIQLADIRYLRGPQAIKSEDTFLVAYVTFDKMRGAAEVDVVENAQRYLSDRLQDGALELPAGVSFRFAGTYENQVRSEKTLAVVLPAALLLIFVILYLQFRSTAVTAMVFSGIFVAWSGGFLLVWLYNQPWFLDAELFGAQLRVLFQIQPINLSVAVWVGFIALFGIASDDGVVMATFLDQSFRKRRPETVAEVRRAVLAGAARRIRPAMMTTATTILALLPVLTSTGRGSDIMIPMAIPTFGGMLVAVLTVFVVPVLYSARMEWGARRGGLPEPKGA